MTTKIRIIPETLANKIAAGEVVQRPASVVKELLENSIDAGADEITVEVTRAGKGLMKVTDNGVGMTKDNALLSIERFATSKLKNEEDLFNIKTLGFRGEALPSIASVSRLSIVTKTADEIEGTLVYIEGGKLKKVQAAGAPTGTSIEVRNLFYNTPARLKFMKSNTSELFHITNAVVKVAASLHNLHIKLISDGRVIVDFTKTADLHNRICDIFESDVYRHLIKVDEKSGGARIYGYVTSPVYTTGSTKKFFTYINGRYVYDKVVNSAIISAYKSLIEDRKYPAVVLFIDIPHDQVDVNVHPSKKDVRFNNQGMVFGLIQSAIKNTLSSANVIDAAPARLQESESLYNNPPTTDRGDSIKQSMLQYLDRSLASQPASAPYTGKDFSRAPFPRNDIPSQDSSARVAPEYTAEDYYKRAKEGAALETHKDMYGDYIKILGQVGASFILCSKGDSLLMIDQHAAHERILFDRLTQEYQEKNVSPQPLLLPIVFELSKTDALLLENYLTEFKELGFVIEPFGKNSYAVKEVPEVLLGYDYKEVIHDIISELMFLNKSNDITDRVSGLLKLLACKGAIKANKKLTNEEIIRLLRDMSQTAFPTNCPHGRPVVIELTQKDIRKMFKRSNG